MKVIRPGAIAVIIFFALSSISYAFNVTIDASDVSTKIKLHLSGYDYIPQGESATYNLTEGTYTLHSYPGGYIAKFDVGPNGTISYEAAYGIL